MRRRDGGYVAAELALGIGLLVLPMTLLVLAFPTWAERRSAAEVAAEEAARAAVLSEDPASAVAAAQVAASAAAVNHGIAVDGLELCLVEHRVDQPPPATCADRLGLARGTAVTARVTVVVPALVVPGVSASVGALGLTVAHTERVDLFRSFP